MDTKPRKPRIGKLGTGLQKLPSGSIRARVRIQGTGTKGITKTFDPVDFSGDMDRTIAAAKHWRAEAERDHGRGLHLDTSKGDGMSLREALAKFSEHGLTLKDSNAAKERVRIKALMSDTIADIAVTRLTQADLDRLEDRFFVTSMERRVAKVFAKVDKNERAQLADLPATLLSIKKPLDAGLNREQVADIRASAEALMVRYDIKPVARTTVRNLLQVVPRCLKWISKQDRTLHGVAELSVGSIDFFSEKRDRRLEHGEYEALMAEAAKHDYHPETALIIDLAIQSSLRLGAIFDLRPSYISNGAAAVIRFPRSSKIKEKPRGTIPVVPAIRSILDRALALHDGELNQPVFRITYKVFYLDWRSILKTTGIKNLRPHDLRHEAVSRMIYDYRLSDDEARTVSGHTSSYMRQHYTHARDEQLFTSMVAAMSADQLLERWIDMARQYLQVGGERQKLAATLANIIS